MDTDENFYEDEIDSYFEEVEKKEENSPDEAFNLLLCATSAINVAVSKNSKIIKKLKGWIAKIKKHLKNLAKKIGASSYSISTGIPAGITITVTWNA